MDAPVKALNTEKAKALQAAGKPLTELTTKQPAPAKRVSEPQTHRYQATKTQVRRVPKQRARKPEPKWAMTHDVRLTREGAPTMLTCMSVSEPRAKVGKVGVTHDFALLLEDTTGAEVRGTVSHEALQRLLTGKGTRVWVGGRAYLATRE